MKYKIFLLMLIWAGSITTAFSFGVKHGKNIVYVSPAKGSSNMLDIYYKKSSVPKDVIVFIHGGSWDSGKKETYWWLGRNFAHKNIVSVIINYSLSPATYEQMATECASALKWVKQNISAYGGDPDRIFVMGHSAGGHLAELINADPRFFKEQNISNPIRGIILDDAFGLDMYDYMSTAPKDHYYKSFVKTFSTDPQTWKKASPVTYISNVANPHLIFIGGRTYPSIQTQSDRFYELLNKNGHPADLYEVKKRRHIAMISQMIYRGNALYKIIKNFIATH